MTANIILPIFQGAFTTILFILVLRQRKQTLQTRVFSFFLLSMSLWGFLIGIMRGSTDLAAAVYWERAALTMIGLTGVSFCVFALSYTGSVSKKWMIVIGLFLLTTAALFPSNLWISGMWVDQYGNNVIWGPAFYPWMVILYSFIVIAIIRLNRARLASSSYEERNRLLFFIFGAGFCLLGGLLDVSIYPGSIPANIFFGLLTSLAILRYHLFDIRVVLRSGMAYLITGFLVAIATVGTGLIWAYFAGKWGFPFWVSIILPSFLILAVPPLWGRVESFVTQHVRREKYVSI
jgi:hypothetical protein